MIVAGGGAGLAAADTLRREGYGGSLTILSEDEFSPYDRPNLSKDYPAGQASDAWMPLRSPDYYSEHHTLTGDLARSGSQAGLGWKAGGELAVATIDNPCR